VIRLTLPNANGKLALDSTIASTGSSLYSEIQNVKKLAIAYAIAL
jgi:hypothetical protein